MTTGSADAFRALHLRPDLLILPNAWDAGSARLIEDLGAPAIATTSAGVAWANGYPDGDALPVEVLLTAIRQIVRVVRVPLTADIEGGYGDDPASVADVVARVIGAGAVGINLEDGSAPPERLCARIAAARQSATAAGVNLFINARTDVVLRGLCPVGEMAGEVMRRAALYRSAGCDGLFVPGLVAEDGIAAVVGGIGALPLNVMARPALPAAARLTQLGVRRLSAGSALAQAVLGLAGRLAGHFLKGSAEALFQDAGDYGALNRLFVRGT